MLKKILCSPGVSMTASWTTRDATPGSSSQSPSQSSAAPLMASTAAHAQMMILPEESASVMAAGGATSEDAEDAVDEYLARLSSEAEGMEDNFDQVGYLKLRLRESLRFENLSLILFSACLGPRASPRRVPLQRRSPGGCL